MKYSTATVAALAGVAAAGPIEKRAAINYVQNYNGNVANFQYNQGAGTFSCSWNNPGDFVVGLGWSTGSAKNIAFSGTYTTNSGSYYAVYGWLNNPLTEYYVVENYSYDPCSAGGTSVVGSVTTDGSSYKICKHTQTNQPSIKGTSTFGQYFSVRATKRNSGTVTMANHFNAWKASGFQPGDFNYLVMAVEAFGGSGSASVTVSEAASGSSPGTSAPATSAPATSAPATSAPATSAPATSAPATSACTKTITGSSSAPPSSPTTSSATSAPTGGSGGSCAALYGQCGGQGWNGPTCCSSGSCKVGNPYYSQCL